MNDCPCTCIRISMICLLHLEDQPAHDKPTVSDPVHSNGCPKPSAICVPTTPASASRVQAVPPSGIRRYFDIAATMEDVVSLGIGEPDFVSPPPILNAGIASLQRGQTSYTSNAGMIELREAVARKLADALRRPRLRSGDRSADHRRRQRGHVSDHAGHPRLRRRGDRAAALFRQLHGQRHPGRRRRWSTSPPTPRTTSVCGPSDIEAAITPRTKALAHRLSLQPDRRGHGPARACWRSPASPRSTT